ncbi:glycosyltransferase family 2 protein, partial [Pseudomonas sp. SIMBA_044]
MDIAISILMPVYNGAPFLKETLDSLVQQTFKKFEVICIDDNST